MYKISWKTKAVRQLEKIRTDKTRAGIIDAVDTLTHFPQCLNVKMLKHHEHGYRLRVGRYRVLFNVDKEIRIIDIQEVKIRNECTY